jgi:hypothetical protein
MKVIFLDFDGVLNSQSSFIYEDARRKKHKEQGVKGRVNETLSVECAAVFQELLNIYPEVKIVVSSTWRIIFNLDELRQKFEEYHIDGSRIIDRTGQRNDGDRGLEIQDWLNLHPEVAHYIVIDDNDWGIVQAHPPEKFVKTSWEYGGFQFGHLEEATQKLKTPKKRRNLTFPW